jgi:hypothetical protein
LTLRCDEFGVAAELFGNLFVCFSFGEARQQLLLVPRQLFQAVVFAGASWLDRLSLETSDPALTATAGKILSSQMGINAAPTQLRSVHAHRRLRDHSLLTCAPWQVGADRERSGAGQRCSLRRATWSS